MMIEAQETPPRRALILPKLNSSESLMSNPSPGDSLMIVFTCIQSQQKILNVEVFISLNFSVIDV